MGKDFAHPIHSFLPLYGIPESNIFTRLLPDRLLTMSIRKER